MLQMTFADALKQAIWSEIDGKLHTAIPAIVTKYYPDGPSVEAVPAINNVFLDGTELPHKPFGPIPVIFPRTNRFSMSFPLEKGDGVLLIFSERSLDNWFGSGEMGSPEEARRFSMTDAIAIPGLFAANKGLSVGDGKSLTIEFDEVKLTSDGKKFQFTGDVEVTGKMTVTDEIEGKDFVPANDLTGMTFKKHTHATAPTGPITGPTRMP